MKFQPLFNRVLIERGSAESKTDAGIYIAKQGQSKPTEGVIVAVGTGGFIRDEVFQSMHVKVGDKVMFSKHAGTEVDVEGKTYLIMDQNEIMGIL